jgi:hypothetical protein
MVDASWPPILTFRRALAYSGKSRATLNRAIQRGDLPLLGRCGGPRGERTIRREDLDRWLSGDVPTHDPPWSFTRIRATTRGTGR